MAAALLAMEHFNARNSSVIPEMSQFENCPIRFDIDNSKFFDTGTVGHNASRLYRREGTVPCAVAGPFNDMPCLDLSTLAQADGVPVVVHRAYNVRVDSDFFSPFTSQVFPDMAEASEMLWRFLLQKGRTNFISLLYALTDIGIQRHESLTFLLDEEGVTWDSRPYESSVQQVEEGGARKISTALQQVKNKGFRTIVVAMENPFLDMPVLASAAEQLGMNNGEYFWLWFGLFEPVHLFSNDTNITKLIAGSAWMLPQERYFNELLSIDADPDPFYAAWTSLGPEFVNQTNAANPIPEGEPGYVYAEPDFFQTFKPEWGAGFLYDAIMNIGIGACLAKRNSSALTGIEHVRGIRSVDFQGATGQIVYEGTDAGSRLTFTVEWNAYNLLPPQQDQKYIYSDVSYAGADGWTSLYPFYYADGRTVPPDLLRETPDQNYLSTGLRAFGLALMGFAILSALIAIAWVYMHRKHRVLQAAQPYFLYLLGFGAIVSASAILPMSFDESNGWSAGQLSASCMARAWLFCLGHTITYGALFSKLWRVNKVLQFSRRKIDIHHVLWPMAILCLAAILVLSLWTGLDPLTWERVVLNDATGETIGLCHSDSMAAYLTPLVIVMVIPALLTLIMAWKTRDVDDAYSESSWIFSMIIVQLEVMVVAVPIVIILRDLSTNGRYIGYVLMLWTFPMSTLAMIFVPKMVAYRRAVRGVPERTRKRGDAHGCTHVSGLDESNPVSGASQGENPSSVSLKASEGGTTEAKDSASVPTTDKAGQHIPGQNAPTTTNSSAPRPEADEKIST